MTKMTNGDWEKFGESIKNTVQDAIDSQDFEKLNQTIASTINNAVNSFTEGMKTAGNNMNRNKQAYSSVRPKEQVYSRVTPHEYSQAGPSRQAYTQARSQGQASRGLYRKKTGVKVWGYIFLTVGGVFGVCSLILLAMGILGIALEPGDLLYSLMSVVLVLGIPTILNVILVIVGAQMVCREARYQTYIWAIGNREFCNVSEIARKSDKKERVVLKDLQYMLRKGWFMQGHLDQNKTCLIVTHKMYEQYLRLENEKMRTEREEAERREQMQAQKSQEEMREKMIYEKLDPQVRKVIEEGDAYILKIRACNDAIPGEEISAKISRMELLVDRIFDRIEQSPESVGDIRRLMEYYLPTTVKLLEAYQELDSQPIDGENIRSSKVEIEATLDTLNTAFEKLLDSLFQDTAWDVSSDISVLHTMLAQEGLTEEEWKK